MKITQIKKGRWYETKVGIGQALGVGGTFPPSVKFHIIAPIPRGVLRVIPRDVVREVQAPQGAE